MKTSIKHLSAGVAVIVMMAAAAGHAQAPVVSPTTPINAPVFNLGQAQELLQAEKWFSAAEAYARLVNVKNDEERGQARYGLALSLSQLGQEDKALQTLEGTLADETPLGRAVGILRAKLLLQLADKALAEGQQGAAAKWLGQYERLIDKPDRARYERIRGAMETVAGVGPTSPSLVLRVGILLPLEGELKPVGDDLLRGVQLGLRDFDGRRGTRVEILPMNVSGADSAREAAEALRAQGVDVVVGPLTSTAVDALKGLLVEQGVPVLALSSDRAVLGGGVHALSYLPAEQARMAARAAYQRGKTRAVGLVPSTPYGYEVFDAYQDEMRNLGGEVVGSAFYNPGNNDIGASIRTLVGSVSGTTNSFSRKFDTMFLPAPGATLPLVVSQLSYYDVDKVGEDGQRTLLVGTALWQDPAVLAPSASGVRGGIFAVPPRSASFDEHFTASFGAAPHPLAVLGYDAMRLLVDIAAEKQRTGRGVNDILLREEGFYGSGGYLRFRESGVTERGLNIVRVGQQFEVQQEALKLAPLSLPGEVRPSGRKRGWW